MSLPFELSVQDYAALRESENPPILLDIREPEEYATAKIAGSVFLPMGQVVEKIAGTVPAKETPLVVHCHHGMRSAKVVEYLRAQGYTHVQNLTGGIDAWSAEIDPLVPLY